MMPEILETKHVQVVAEKLAAELAALRLKVQEYFYEEVVTRGDKGMIKEYKERFGIS